MSVAENSWWLPMVTGLVGVFVGAIISHGSQLRLAKKQRTYERRYNLFISLMKHRGRDLNRAAASESVTALNLLRAEFRGDDSVTRELDNFLEIPVDRNARNNSRRAIQFQNVCLAVAQTVLENDNITLDDIDSGYFPPYHLE